MNDLPAHWLSLNLLGLPNRELWQPAIHQYATAYAEAAVKAALEQAEKDARRWIPVSERLPACAQASEGRCNPVRCR